MCQFAIKAQQHLDLFEPWKEDHNQAMECRDFEEWLTEAVCVYDYLWSVTQEIKRLVFSGVITAEERPAISNAFVQFFEHWKKTAVAAKPSIEKFRASFGNIEGTKELEERINKADIAVETLKNLKVSLSPSSHQWKVTEEEARKVDEVMSDTNVKKFKTIQLREGNSSLVK